jgi:G3E family GTPase
MHTVMTSPVERLRPLTIVGGAAGVGKSTLLRHQLLNGGHHPLAVVVSNLDSLQLDGSDIVSRDSTFMTLANGSLCCETDGDVTSTLAMLRKRLHPDTHVLLEARHDASMRRFAGYGYTPGYRLDGTVVVADAKSLDGELEADQFSRLRTHIGSAEIVVINKLDLLTAQRPQTVRDTVSTMHHTARAIPTSRGRVPPPLLLGVGPDDAEIEDRAVPATWKTSFRPAPRRANAPTESASELEPSYRMWTLSTTEPLTGHDFRYWAAHLPSTIVRARGTVHLSDDHPYRYRFDLVGAHHTLRREDPWGSQTPETRLALVGV